MEGLHSDFIERLQETLLVCAPFDDFTALTHLFVDARIYPWRNDIRYRPNSVGLIDEVVFQLHNRTNLEGQNALLLFLQVVRDRTESDDACHGQLTMLVEELQEALAASPESEALIYGAPKASLRTVPRTTPRHVQARERARSRDRLWERDPAHTEQEVLLPRPSARMEALGFSCDPFAWREAEKIASPQVLEELFVAHPDFDAKVMTLNRATVLVAPRGGGKTAGRLTLQERLNQMQAATFAPYHMPEHKRVAPFVAVYSQFEQLIPRLPAIGLVDHQDLLSAALARALLAFISAYKRRFLSLPTRARLWWWSYLATYLRGIPLHYAVADEQLRADWVQHSEGLIPPFAPRVSLRDLLSSFLQKLRQDFGINNLFILVDGVDGYVDTQTPENLRALLMPLLGAISLLSLPGIVWKFFLPSMAEMIAYDSAGFRTGRVELLRLEWDEHSLVQILQRRLVWASQGFVEQLDAVAVQNLRSSGIDLEHDLARIALSYRFGPPRALLALSHRLFHPDHSQRGPATPLTEAEWYRFRRWVGQDVRANLRDQTRRLQKKVGHDLAFISESLNSFNDDALFLVQRAWNELDFYPAEPGELETALEVFTQVLAKSKTVGTCAEDATVEISSRVKLVIPAVLAYLIHETPIAVDARWIPTRVVSWLREVAGRWLRS